MKKNYNFTLVAPKYFCLIDEIYYETSIKFINEITFQIEQGNTVNINLNACHVINPPAALLLFSTVNSLQLKYGFECIACVAMTKSSGMLYDPLISSSGLWDALTCKNREQLENLIKNNNRFKTSINPSITKNVEQILSKIEGMTPEHIFFLTMAMKEAITNVVYHAYDFENVDEKRWWQCAWVNIRDRIANIIIHDRGIGIIERYRKPQYSDEQLLKEAMIQGFSSTGLSNRGMGSEDMKRPIDELFGDQSLTLFTGNYIYSYTLNSLEPKIIKRKSSICGTLIYWRCEYGDRNND